MTDRKVVDFDRWRAERAARQGEEDNAPVFRIGGKEYPLPVEPPAHLAIDAIRLKHDLNDDAEAAVPIEALARMRAALFGEDTFRELLVEHKIGAAEMGDLVIQAMSVWKLDEDEARPNRQTRRRKRSTSSRTGR